MNSKAVFRFVALIGATIFIGCSPSFVDANADEINASQQPIITKGVSFKTEVIPLFSKVIGEQTCISCHTGNPSMGNLNLNIDQQTDQELYDALLFGRVDKDKPEDSALVARPIGTNHQKFLEKDSPEYSTLLKWVEQGANFEAPTIIINPGDIEDKPDTIPTPAPNTSYFAKQIYSKLGSCAGCHNGGARIDLNDPDANVVCNNIKNFAGAITAGSPTTGSLYRKPINLDAHNGGKIWSEASEGELIKTWAMNKQLSCTTP